MSELAIALSAGLAAMAGWGLADFLAKVSVDRIGSMAALVWAHIFGTALIVTVVFARDLATGTSPHLPDTAGTWLAVAVFGAGQAAVYLLVYRAFEKGRLAILNPIFSAYAGLAALLAIILFGGHASPSRLVALVAVFVGVMLLSLDTSAHDSSAPGRTASGLAEILTATGLAAWWTVLWAQLIAGQDWWTYAALMYVCMCASLVAFAATRRLRLARPRGRTALLLAGIGTGEVLAYLAISVGFSETPYTAVVALLSGAFSIPAIVLARCFLGDRLHRIHLLGAGAVVAGTALVAAVGGV